jgi:hypothetical protein
VLCNWRGIFLGGYEPSLQIPAPISTWFLAIKHHHTCPMVCPTRHVDRTCWVSIPLIPSTAYLDIPILCSQRGWWKSIHSNLSTIWGTYGAVRRSETTDDLRVWGVERWVLK